MGSVKRLSMLDQCALDPKDIGAAQLLFDKGTHTLHEARQAVARYKLSNGWLPQRLTVTNLATTPLPFFRREHVWSNYDYDDSKSSSDAQTITEIA